jgi:glycosyltransferase involved in cell wall biosynthesis
MKMREDEGQMHAESLKVCFVSMQYPPHTLGGAGVYAHCLCNELAKRGHEIHVITYTTEKTRSQNKTNNVHVHRITVTDKPILKTASYWLKLRKHYKKLQKEIGFDLLHANVTSDLSLTKNLVKTPRIVTIHHLAKTTFSVSNHLSGFKEETSVTTWLEKKLFDFDKTVMQRADKIIAVSHFTKASITSAYHIPSSKIQVIYNGIYPVQHYYNETEIIETKKTYAIKNQPAILYVGRLEQRKGLIFLLQAFALLSKEITCSLIIAGDGDQARYKKIAESFGVKDKVIFTGHLDEASLKRLYVACTVFVLPSLLEGFGLTLLEAMSSAKPVVATNVGGIPEIIKNDVHGKLVEPKNPEQLCAALRFYIENPENAKKTGERNRKYVTETFSWTKAAAETELLYKSLIQLSGVLHENN